MSIKESVKALASQRIKEENPITLKELQEAFKEAFSGMFQPMFEAEMENQLGYSRYDWRSKDTNNSRNGHSKKKLK